MKRTAVIIILIVIFVSCAKVPITGRRQVEFVPESMMLSMSLTNYKDFLTKNPPAPVSDANYQMMMNSGLKISQAVEKFLKNNGMADRVKDFKWEFNLVNNKEVNAWCMPGGKVVVYTGILPLTKDETGLAVVMGHEIAHAVARHGNERMSQQLMVMAGGLSLDIAMQKKPEQTKNIFLSAYGAGSTLGVLAYSRLHETEADKMGLIFIAMAGYDPSNAIEFWERMSKLGGTKPPEFLSTHPSDAKRIADLKKYLPEAMKYYKKN